MTPKADYRHCLLLIVLTAVRVLEVVSYNLVITPEHVQIKDDVTAEVNITCTADAALTGCQFSAWAIQNKTTVMWLDLRPGIQYWTNASYSIKGVTGYAYNGRGLEEGDCGVTLHVVGMKQWVVGCRVCTAERGWKYAWTELVSAPNEQYPVSVAPKEVVVLPGASASFLCRAPGPLTGCSFVQMCAARHSIEFNRGHRSPTTSTMRHTYHGAGLENGDCGISMTNITEADNGLTACYTWQSNKLGTRYVPIIVAKPPRKPIIKVFYSGDNLGVFCTVRGGRPAPKITWLLDDFILPQEDNDEDAPADGGADWRWPWDVASITKRMPGILEPQDLGKRLRCVVSHVALPRPLETSALILSNNTLSKSSEDQSAINCPQPDPLSLEASCRLNGTIVPCETSLDVGTQVLLSCKEGLISTTGKTRMTVTCQPNGQWSEPLLTCTVACGVRNDDFVVRITGGSEAEEMEFPFQAALYHKNPDKGSTLICGGSLITTKHVLTAAHCFLGNEEDVVETNPITYRVIVGKHNRPLKPKEPLQQRRLLARIHTHELFTGHQGRLRYDIAVVELQTPVTLSSAVQVVCVDWDMRREGVDKLPGKYGTVSGWGVTGDDKPSNVLMKADLEIVSNSTCYDSIPAESRGWLTSDKFCAGYNNRNTSVCKGDSGGGLIFQRPSGRYDLLGVVSTSFMPFTHTDDTCYAQSYAAFTCVADYVEWIRNIVETGNSNNKPTI